MKSWIKFNEGPHSPSGKTQTWFVKTKDDSRAYLGEIRWYAPWRCYAFWPEPGTIFERDCLRNIANFCGDQTQQHKWQLKQEKQK